MLKADTLGLLPHSREDQRGAIPYSKRFTNVLLASALLISALSLMFQ